MPALEAEIQVADLAEPVDTFRVLMEQPTDQVGRPSAEVRIRPLLLTLTGLAATRDFFTEWAIDSYMRRSGWLVVYERDQVRWRLAFYDAYCVLHDTLFQPGRGRAAYELTLALSPAAVELNGIHSEIHSDLWWEKNAASRFRALTKPAELLPGPGVRSRPAERPPSRPQELLPSPALSALTRAPLVSKPPKTALDPKKKPLYAPTIAKWYKKGGAIEQLDNGDWKYTDWLFNSIIYQGKFPNFTPHQRQQVDIQNMKGNHTTDYIAASRAAPKGKALKQNTWHHNQNLTTMQEVPEDIHARFTHFGACSIIKAQNAMSTRPARTSTPSKINRK